MFPSENEAECFASLEARQGGPGILLRVCPPGANQNRAVNPTQQTVPDPAA
jgi:hypothetical protein